MKLRQLLLLAFIATPLILTSCDDADDSGSEFPEPQGVALQLEGSDIVRYMNGTYEYDPDNIFDDYVDGDQVVLSVHDPFQNLETENPDRDPRYYTPVLNVVFLDADGNEIPYPEEDEDDSEYRLNWEWMKDDISNIEQHGSDGSWGFHLRADHEGDTGIRFRVDYCEGGGTLESIDGENTRQDEVRDCPVEEVTLFEASGYLDIHVGEYEGTDENGRYPHDRHERKR